MDPIEWIEHPDHRFPGRTVIIGRINGKTYAASYCVRRENARDAIRAAVRADGAS